VCSSDLQYYEFGKKFGKVWSKDDYKKSYVSNGADSTIPDFESETPVSYFQPNNNMFLNRFMGYHADMPHVKELSYPGRALYMFKNTVDGSGSTVWLNLELGWEQCTDEEKEKFAGITFVMQDMYRDGERIEEVPFLKENPKTKRLSPAVNCHFLPGKTQNAWIRYAKRDGKKLSPAETHILIYDLYDLLESKKDTLYTHNWIERDIVVYDNWFNVHKRESINKIEGNRYRQLRRLTFNM